MPCWACCASGKKAQHLLSAPQGGLQLLLLGAGVLEVDLERRGPPGKALFLGHQRLKLRHQLLQFL